MQYKVLISPHARKILLRLEHNDSLMITDWMRKALEASENPTRYATPLRVSRKWAWSYRLGSLYRIIADINDDRILILTIEAGYIREIYKEA